MIIDNVITIPASGTEIFTKSILRDGIAWTSLYVIVTIQRRSDGYYWDNVVNQWINEQLDNDATEHKDGQYILVGHVGLFAGGVGIFDVTWRAADSGGEVYKETEQFQVVTGIVVDSATITDTITASETAVINKLIEGSLVES